MFDLQTVVSVAAAGFAFVAGMFVEDRFMVFPAVRSALVSAKAKVAAVKDAVTK